MRAAAWWPLHLATLLRLVCPEPIRLRSAGPGTPPPSHTTRRGAPGVPPPVNFTTKDVPYACACSQVCMPTATLDSSICFDPIPRCAAAVRWYEPRPDLKRPPGALDYKLAILDWNTVYRISDLVRFRGRRPRLDAMIILCESRYRGTLLREALKRSSLIDGRPVSELPDRVLERILASRTEGADTPGYSRLKSDRGQNGVRMQRGTRWVSEVLSERYERGECETAPPSALVIVARLGDAVGINNVTQLLGRVDGAYAALRASGAQISVAIVSGVLQYATDPLYWKGGPPPYSRAAGRDDRSVAAVDAIVAHCQKLGLAVRVRSEPDVDRDLCYYVFSPHVVTGTHTGFPQFIQILRNETAASRRRARGRGASATAV